MTLRKCTIKQLDDRFWRVDWDGRAAEAKTANCTLSARPPAVAERDGESWFFAGIWSQSLDDALSRFDLTRHSPAADPETAEEVLRANARIHPGYGDAHVVSGFTRDHARAILAELDRVRRERDERTEGWRKTERKLAKLSKDMREVSEMLFESKVEVERLRSGMMPAAQRPVDAEAVLAPIRKLRAEVDESRRKHGLRADAYASTQNYDRAHEHVAQRECLAVVVNDMGDALAEAEKIGRGE